MNEKYTVEWIEQKSPDWKVCTLKGENGSVADVSINRVNKKGEVFPNFDAITLQATVMGNLWRSDAGKSYLFAPKEVSATGTTAPHKGNFGGGMKLMEKKSEGIAKAQEHKDLGIMTSSTLRMAVDLTVASMRNDTILQNATESDIKGMIKTWREWLVANWELDVTAKAPF